MDAVDHPSETGMPVDAFQQATGRRGRHHIVADAFRFHLGPREAGVIAPDLHLDRHRITPFSISSAFIISLVLPIVKYKWFIKS